MATTKDPYLTSAQILGVIENMSGFICPKCSEVHDIFGKGGAKQTAVNMGIDFLGEVRIFIASYPAN